MIFKVNGLKTLFLLAIIFLALNVKAQIPSTCFEIESILVDACGSPEGENEMVRFVVGNTPLNVANMNVSWANSSNPWLNTCKNTTTANAVNALNATVQGCGLLLEPTNGILPAGARVLLVTSTAIDVNANSFANLADTMYVIFQCAGNTAGHFANWSTSPGMRTLSISFSSPSGCSDVVTYDRTLLVNQNGTIGGASAIRDGALANFDWQGNVTYDNFACQAPFVPANISITALSPTTICPGDNVQLTVSASSSLQNLLWTGGNGSFSSTTSNSTTYTSSLNDTSDFYIYVEGSAACGTITDSILITINPPATATQNASICQGQTYTLPGGSQVNTQGTYIDTLIGGAASGCDSIITTNLAVNNFTTGSTSLAICQGDSILLGGAFQTTAGNYIDTLVGGSSVGCDSIITTILSINPTKFTTQSFTECSGFSITVGGNVYASTGIYTDILTTSLGCDSIVETNLTIIATSQVNIVQNNITICRDELLTGFVINAVGGANLVWSSGETGVDSIIVFTEGIYTVTSNDNGCTSEDQIEIIRDECLVPTIFVPNTFTPNNDNNNDVFMIKGSEFDFFEATIFNRWGEQLFSWKEIDEGWDGTYKGSVVPTGTYFYLIDVTFLGGKREFIKGSVTLLR